MNEVIKLQQEGPFKDRYYCDITEYLDGVIGVAGKPWHYRNYLMDTRDLWSNAFAIRVPGRTTGMIELDENNKIVKCIIAEDCCGDEKRYPQDVNERLLQFVGKTIQMDEVNQCNGNGD